MPVKVLTNHKSLEYFMTTKKLTPRQPRWAEFLSEFNFKVTYQTGKKNDKADALTRKPNKRPANKEDKRQEYRMQVLLPPERIEIQPIEVTNKSEVEHDDRVKATRNESVEAERADKEEINKPETEYERPRVAEPPAEPQPAKEKIEDEGVPAASPDEEVSEDLPTLPDRVKESNQSNMSFLEVREYLANPEGHDRPVVYLRGNRAENGLLYKNSKLWVTEDLRLDVIQEVHNQPAVGHTGVSGTILAIQQHYFWPKMKKDIDQYIRNCHVCRRAKALQDRYNGTLKPLPVPERPWTNITMDFVTGLPECELKNAIFMVVDQLAKKQVYIPCLDKDEGGTNAEATAKMLLHNV